MKTDIPVASQLLKNVPVKADSLHYSALMIASSLMASVQPQTPVYF